MCIPESLNCWLLSSQHHCLYIKAENRSLDPLTEQQQECILLPLIWFLVFILILHICPTECKLVFLYTVSSWWKIKYIKTNTHFSSLILCQ